MKQDRNRQIQGLPLREHQVLWYWMSGYTMGQTATDLGISQNTVREYRQRLRKRLDATTKPEIIEKGRAILAGLGPVG